jgi:anti-anti-sigma factor
MEIRASREGEAVVLAPDGSLAGAEETNAIEARLAAVQKAGERRIVVDCTGVGQVTSAALRALLATSRKLARSQGRLVLFGMNAKVKKAFTISGFDKDFTVVETRDEALRAVVEPAAPRTKAARPAAAPPAGAAPAAVVGPPAAPTPAAAAAPVAVPEPGAAVSPPVFSQLAPPPPAHAPDPREALANSLLVALGARVVPPTAARSAGFGDTRFEAAASAVLSALGVRRG